MAELKEWKPAWKVLAYGFSAFRTHKSARVFYPVKDVATPKPDCGPLACFRHYEDAEFFRCRESYDIVPVAYLESCHLALWDASGQTRIQCPTGTVFADAVYRFG